jgi:trans-aconitate methyltransferase
VAHTAVGGVLLGVLQARPGATRVLDLGCGNGALLRAVRREAAFFPIGYDTNRIAIAKAWQAMPSGRWVVGNLVWDDWTVERPDVLLLMPGRVLELPNDNRPWQFLAKIFTVPTIIVYAYADWIATTGGLAAMCARLGWPVEMKITGPDVEVGVLRADHP